MFFALKVVVWIELVMIAGWILWQQAASREFRGMFPQRYLVLILAIPVICFMSPRPEIIHILAVLIVPLVARDKAEAVCVFVLCLFLFPHLETRIQAGSAYVLSVSVGMSLTIGLAVAYLMRRGPTASISKPILVAVLLFAGLLVVSALRVGGVPIRPIIDIILRVVLPTILVASMITTVEGVRRAMAAMLLAGVCLALLAIVETARSWPIYQEVYRIQGMPPSMSSAMFIRGGVMRAPTTFVESTSFSILLTMCMFVIIWLRGVARSPLWRGALAALILAAMLAAVSRGAFLGLAVGLVVANVIIGKTWRAIGILAAAAGVFLTARILAPYSTFLSGIFNTRSVSGEADFRVDLLNAGVTLVREHPVTGLPVTTVLERLSFLQAGGLVDFVNTYLFYAMTAGIPGALIFALVIIVPFVAVTFARRRLIESAPWETAVLVSMSGTIFVLFFFTSYFERNPYWLFLTAAWASILLNARQPAIQPASKTPKRVGSARLPTLA